ncbi:MAG: hypothetical protein ABIU06_17675 [Anaerolineales bacterium]
MKKIIIFIFPSVLILTMFLSGCGNSQLLEPIATTTDSAIPTIIPTITITTTVTPDLCSQDNIKAEVDKVHRHMREFDDASLLATSMPRDQLSSSIADLQRIRREAEDEVIPTCLGNLRTYQIQHMNSVIETLLAFVRGNTDQEALNQAIALAGQQHDQYVLELARLLGLTPVAGTAVAFPSATPTP